MHKYRSQVFCYLSKRSSAHNSNNFLFWVDNTFNARMKSKSLIGHLVQTDSSLLIHAKLLCSIVLSISITLIFQTGLMASTFLFFGIPAIVLSVYAKKQLLNIFLISLIISLPMSLIIDYIGTINQQWLLTETASRTRILGVVYVEMFLWGFLSVFTIILYYSIFISRVNQINFNRIIWPFLIIALFFLSIQYILPDLLLFDYAYLVIGIFFSAIPFTIWLLSGKRSMSVFRTIPIFFLLGFSFEIAAVYNELWSYPGKYLWVLSLGKVNFPLEELLFWNISLPFCISSILDNIIIKS